jgi:hypothetical protein
LRSGEERSTNAKPSTQPEKGSDKGANDRAVGAALRSVYQNAVDETVPDDLLDLLNKLG